MCYLPLVRTALAACVVVAVTGWVPAAAAGKAELVAAFDDAATDAHGPGSYVAPGDSEIRDGDFDLRRFEVWRDGREVVFKVTFAMPFREPGATARTSAIQLQLWNRIYLQNVDIYIDTDPGAVGHTSCIPGRRVAFPVGQSWKKAVVLTPQPGPAQNITEAALGGDAIDVVFPKNLQTTGRTVIARVPIFDLGGAPTAAWGYSVHVSGASWERTFSAVDRIFKDKLEPNAFTMPVVPVREAWAFGGAPDGRSFPRVVDVLLPAGFDQKRVLSAWDDKSGQFARVPFVSLAPSGPAAAAPSGPAAAPPPSLALPEAPAAPPPPPPPRELRVADFVDTAVTIDGDVAGIKPMMIGRVVDGSGATVARLIVGKVLDHGLLASVIDGQERLERGAAVKFDAAPK